MLPPCPSLVLVALPGQRMLSVDRQLGHCVVWEFDPVALKRAFLQWRLLTGWDEDDNGRLALEKMSEEE